MAFQQDTSGQGYSPDTSSRGQKGLGSRLGEGGREGKTGTKGTYFAFHIFQTEQLKLSKSKLHGGIKTVTTHSPR